MHVGLRLRHLLCLLLGDVHVFIFVVAMRISAITFNQLIDILYVLIQEVLVFAHFMLCLFHSFSVPHSGLF